MQVLRKRHTADIILSFLIALFLIGLSFNTNPCLVWADSTPDRTPTFSATHGTATANELVAAMDIPAELVISSSLARASSVHQPVLNFPLDTSSRKWYCSQGAKSSFSHYGSSAYALDFTDTVKEEDGTIRDLTGVENVPIFAAAGGEVIEVVWDKTGKAPVANVDPGNYVKIYHGDGFTTSYCHMQYGSIPLSLRTLGAKVQSGQFLGYMGNTGSTTGGPTEGTHLHFAVKYKNLGDKASAILDKAMLAGRLITNYVADAFYPDSADFSDKTGAHVLNALDCPLSGFPISSNSFAVISTGNAADATKPNTEGSLSTQLNGLNNEQGNDLVQLSVTLKVPPGTQGWLVDWKFLSEEYPEWVGSQYNDAFLIETPFSSFKISGFATIEGPYNVALDPDGNLVCVNTVGIVGMSAWKALGTTYDGATATLTAGAPVPAGAEIITIVFSVMDLGDSIYDTTVFLDNFRFIKPIHVPPLDVTSFFAYVPPEQVQVVFATSWMGSDVIMTLVDPSGGIIDRNITDPDVVHDVGPDFEMYTIFDPMSGDWLVNLYGADVPPEGEDVEFRLMFSTIPPINLPPVAEAGPDQKVYAIPPATTAMVTLDGSGSYDSDGDPLTYTWSWGDNTTCGVNPTVELSLGTTTIILVVNDGKIDSLPDTVDVTVSILAAIDFDPDVLNLRSTDKYVTAYIELPQGFDVRQIGISSIRLNDTVPALTKPTKVGDYDRDRVADLMVKFDASAVKAILTLGDQVEITVTGEVTGIPFEGMDTIRVIDPTWYTLDISSTTGGSVTVPGEGTFSYKGGTVVNLVALPASCYHFVNWAGDISTIDDPADAATTIVMNGDYDIVANFECTPMVAAGWYHTVGLKADGTMVAVGGNYWGQLDVGNWTDIVNIAAGGSHTVGTRSDGTVVAVGRNEEQQCNVGNWSDIIQVAAGIYYTVGLRSDGTVVAVGDNSEGQCDVGGWTDIVQVAAGGAHTVGVKADGTVVAVGDNSEGQCGVGGWTDVVQVAAGDFHTVGLKSNGTAIAVGYCYFGECNVGGWTGIIQIAAGAYHTVGLSTDGSLVAVGNSLYEKCDVGGWTDITQVAAGLEHTVGVKANGIVVAVGDNHYGQCNVGGWDLN